MYYENFAGKIKILKKADPATFVSNNDAHFAWDAKSIFWGRLSAAESRLAILADRECTKGSLKG